jgi:hypothetical protein
MVETKKKKTKPLLEMQNPKTLGEEQVNETFEKIWPEVDDMGRRIITAGDERWLCRASHRSGLWEIFSPEGREPPLELRGWFTNISACEDALCKYAARKSHKGVIAKDYAKKLEETGFFNKE